MKTFNQISQTERVRRSPHTGRPILEVLNLQDGYYSTRRSLSEREFATLVEGSTYEGPEHPAETKARANRSACG